MRYGRLAFIALLGIAAIGALAMLATNVQSLITAYPDFRPSRSSANIGPTAVEAVGSHAKGAVSTADMPIPETVGAAEKMFLGGLSNDFGAVAHDAQPIHHFPITNIYTAPLAIAYLQPSCRCIAATAAERILQPGESSTIDVQLDARRFTGPNTQTVRVKIVGDNFVSTCKLVVSAVSRPDGASEIGQAGVASTNRGEKSTPPPAASALPLTRGL
jgi:Protein of unknown function (DUF1573)